MIVEKPKDKVIIESKQGQVFTNKLKKNNFSKKFILKVMAVK